MCSYHKFNTYYFINIKETHMCCGDVKKHTDKFNGGNKTHFIIW